MTRPLPSPLEGISRLIVDGTNLLYALAASSEPVPAASLIGRLRSIVPGDVAVVVALDGSPAPGSVTRRVAAGVEVRYAGSRPADDLIRALAAGDAASTLVVTDDRELRALLSRMGIRSAGNPWLLGLLARQRLVAPAAGRPRSPQQATTTGAHDGDDDARSPWRPGRGATRKTGNPRRARRARPG